MRQVGLIRGGMANEDDFECVSEFSFLEMCPRRKVSWHRRRKVVKLGV
jgi:hypothetical protein